MSKMAHNLLVVKGIVTFGFLVYVFVPTEFQYGASLATNLLWLWRT